MQIFIFLLDSPGCSPRENTDVLIQDKTGSISDYIIDDDNNSEEETSDDNDDEEVSHVLYERVGNVRRISVQPAADNDLEGSDTMTCLHGKDRAFCTICSRPMGRCGREFKKKQDDERRKRQRKRGGLKNFFKRGSF